MYNTFSLKCSFEVLNHIIIMNWAYPRTQEQIELLYWTPEAWEIEFRYKTMYMKILVNWFLLGDQEAGPTDQAAWPDPWQGAAHTEEGLQLQVFIKVKRFSSNENQIQSVQQLGENPRRGSLERREADLEVARPHCPENQVASCRCELFMKMLT